MKCPHCGSSHLRRSHVRFWEVPFEHLTRRRPHRCGDCHRRRWLVDEQHRPGEHPHLPAAADALVPPQGEPDLAAIDSTLSRK